MSPEAQRIAIAEACGLLNVRTERDYYDEFVVVADFGGGYGLVPDYLNDLNAMHEAEKVLTKEQEARYVTLLCLEVQPTPKLYHATAIQRAEAFLRTIGKWVD